MPPYCIDLIFLQSEEDGIQLSCVCFMTQPVGCRDFVTFALRISDLNTRPIVRTVDSPRLHTKDPTIIEDLTAVGKELEEDGVRAIICACGYFGRWQKQLAERLNVPVYASSLTQIPMIKIGLKKDQKIGVLCAVTRTFDDELLSCCGVDDPSILVVRSMEEAPEFSAIPRDRDTMNSAKVRQEMVQAAKELVAEHPEIGAILLECSDMPPYAYAVQEAVNLPVYDFTTMCAESPSTAIFDTLSREECPFKKEVMS